MIRIFVIFLVYLNTLYATPTLTISHNGQVFDEFKVLIYEDKSHKLKIKDIQNIDDFKPYTNRIDIGYSDSTFWFKFDIKNKTNKKIKYFLHATEHFFHDIECYIISKNNNITSYKEGVGNFEIGKQNRLQNPTFEINLNKDETKTIYLKSFTIYPNSAMIQLLNEQSLNEYILEYNQWYFLYFGTFTALIIYRAPLKTPA